MLRRVLALLVLGSLLLAACGGDGDEGSGDGGSAEDGLDNVGGGEDLGGVFGSAQCAEVAAAMASAAGAAGAAFTGGAADLEASVEQMQAFADAAPDEIRDDLQLIYEAYAEFIQVMTDSGWDPTSGEAPPPEVIAQLDSASQALNAEEVQAASERVNAYIESGCEG
jgi:hypothetical protein